MLRALIVVVLLLLPQLAAAKSVWVEVTGRGAQYGAQDADAARRRAVADAMLQAALAGGAQVAAHSAQSFGVMTSDLLIVRPLGRVLETQILSERFDGTFWNVTLRARIGPEAEATCARRPILVTLFEPQIHVSTLAPAWAEPLAALISTRIRREIGQLPGVSVQRASAMPQPAAPGSAPGQDYLTLMQGELRMAPGEHAFTATIDLGTAARGLWNQSITLDLQMALTDGQGHQTLQRLQSSTALPTAAPLFRAGVLLEPGRERMATQLTKGVGPALKRLTERVYCAPATIVLSAAGGQIIAPIGRRNGLNRGSIAFTTDADFSTDMLEVVELGASRAVLRPLDPQLSPAAFDGRRVRFLETGQ